MSVCDAVECSDDDGTRTNESIDQSKFTVTLVASVNEQAFAGQQRTSSVRMCNTTPVEVQCMYVRPQVSL